MGQHLVAPGQDEGLAFALQLDLAEEARQVDRADGGTDDAAERAAHADRHDHRQDRLADDLRPYRLAPARPVHRAGAGEQAIGEGDVLPSLLPHAAVGAHEALRLALDRQDDEAYGLGRRRQRAQREQAPLGRIVEVDLAAGDGFADIGELGAHRIEMGLQATVDEIDHQLVALPRGVLEVGLGHEPGRTDDRRHRQEHEPDQQHRQQPGNRPARAPR